MSSYFAYNTRDIKFVLKEWLPTDEVFGYKKYRDYYSKEDIDPLIDQIYKITAEIIAPTNKDGENTPAYFKDGQVFLPESFKQLYKYIQENGWGTSNIDENAGGTLPHVILGALTEIMCAGNPAFTPYIGLTTGAARLIQKFGDQKQKELFLPPMMNGTWSGTMCLTEPTAGSDVGDITSKAYPTENPHIFNIKGNKIFISGGDADFVENIVHMYLARIEGAVPGTKGISLFIVPKYWPNEDGSLTPNDIVPTGVEHKMGMKGSATTALSAGENGNCRGWLLGTYDAETGIGEGMSQMFQMMNEARLITGVMGLAVTANAYWNTAGYCKERIQGRPTGAPSGAERVPIIMHEDVKRMLLLNKATLEACRAIIMKTYYYVDIAENDPDPERRKWAAARVECLTPVAKAYPTDEAWPLIGECIQAYGGYGYCEDYPVAQAARDCKVLTIWEGTNFIQSMDLVGRKWQLNGGKPFRDMLKEIENFADRLESSVKDLHKECINLKRTLAAYRRIQEILARCIEVSQYGMLPTYSRRVLTATAQLYGAYCLLEQSVIALRRISEIGDNHYDYDFYYGKVLSARYYLHNVVPSVWTLAEILENYDTSVIEAPTKVFEY